MVARPPLIRPGSPAESAGLRIGQQVLTIDGAPMRNLHGAERWSELTQRASLRVVVRDGDVTSEFTVPVFELIPVM